MLDLRTSPPLNKLALIGGCLRLPFKIDIARLRAEVEALPLETWETTGGRIAVHRDAGSVFLRGFAPKEGDKPIEDRPALDALPYAREIIETRLGAKPLRCLLARLAGGGVVTEHTDIGDYFIKTIRIHVPVITNPKVHMICNGLSYTMAPGEVWALNNSTQHAVWNADPEQTRTHMICDYLPTPQLVALLKNGSRNLGRRLPQIDEKVRAVTVERDYGR